MRKSIRSNFATLKVVIATAAFFVSASQASAASLSSVQISDSLVKNLRCANLSPDSVLRSLQPDAFAASHQLPVHNWSAGSLAECWSLAHAQRLTFYMARFGQSAKPQRYLTPKYLEPVEDMFSVNSVRRPAPFAVPDIASLAVMLQQGFTDQSGRSRTFKADIEAYQEWRFYQFSNTEFIFGGRERSTDDNVQSFSEIKSGLAHGRLPMVILRPSMTGQHVVLIKKMYPADARGIVNFDLYDSNYPYMDNHAYYDQNTQQFYAPSVIRGLDSDPYSALGLFVVDDDDMDTIQNELYRYYSGRCQIEKGAAAKAAPATH